ncbi:L-seryl-tRNA(Sec) selenium transferase [Corynebacterium poyangense]|uniref:L-seryl-tRNA(Sec) selenium transferase n=1 Tax=Corynebacterium poyangense TaxID=2684405 RepID=A0A7H0SN50_9CORY|nr:L-seryl-tRNA(Sec) selenium transferase [Corynebacterium poyangense]QNQ89975.1 L-seryl-tRNA(Sec) selenium transferase [Corynebacterium poyangense]
MAEGTDPRRSIPGTDKMLQHPEIKKFHDRVRLSAIRDCIHQVQHQAREGKIAVDDVYDAVMKKLREQVDFPGGLVPVINATGVVVHTNLGRAPLSPRAQEAVRQASGYVDVEMDLESGQRSQHRGRAATAALCAACPPAEDALVVNNGASALLLTTAALAGPGAEILISRGELIEIGAGFRLPELIESTGVNLTEVGATNRTHLHDYVRELDRPGNRIKAILKVHPSNYRVVGFHSEVSIKELHQVAQQYHVPVIMDVGSGLLTADSVLADEPDCAGALRQGADLVIASGDKLLGGPQAGIILGRKSLIRQCSRHPLARAVRVNKLTLAALAATVNDCEDNVPVRAAIHADPDELKKRCLAVYEALSPFHHCQVVAHDGRVGGGGAPGVPLSGWALELPEHFGRALRLHRPVIMTRIHDGRCLVDLRCVPENQDHDIIAAIRTIAEV